MASKLVKNYIPEFLRLSMHHSKPSMVTVNLTNRCDQQCIYCEIGRSIPSPKKDALTIDDLRWIIDQMAVNRISRISLCGGEPFLFKGIIDVVAYAGKKNIRCSITTNGMTAHKLNESELDILKECTTEIYVSVDSFQDSIQSYTRGMPAALSNALKSIQRLSEKHIPVTVLTAISKYNYHDLFNFLTNAYEKGIKQVLFQPIIYYSNYPDRPTIDNKAQLNVSVDNLDILMDELRKILRFERKHKINTNVYRILPWIEHYIKTAATQNGKWFFNDVLNKFFCREIYAIIDISYNGGIQPCGLSLATINIHDNRHLGLMALWSKATLGIKDDLLNGRYHEYCNGCCHHFSRNMLASIMKYPIKNRVALINMLPLLFLRIHSRMLKNL
ncbi:MAG: radical SAM protein [Bacteroidales bacterium]|nr:radical SAM protein [Bacteroidales bacterium]